jgi:hypothetical protein
MDDDDRSTQVRSALLKILGVIVVIAIVIFIGTTFLVHALGLHSDDSNTPVGSSVSTPSPLPSSALPQPSDSDSPSPTPTGSESPDADGGSNSDIELEVSPVIASPMARINLTGTYKGADNVTLQVQRFDEGGWSNFDAKTTVKVGTFATYIMTGRVGENRFRVFDPQAHKGSNVILVTIQ